MFGVSSMTATLRKVAVKKPGPSIINADPNLWHYGEDFNPAKILNIHEEFVKKLEKSGAEVYWMPENDRGIADAVFTYDASLMTPSGAILMSPGKALREGEQKLHSDFYKSLGIKIIGAVEGAGRAEAGDTLWLDEKTLLIGRGFRTNQIGAEQLERIISLMGIDVHIFDLPVYLGAAACLHLMSLISLVDSRIALVCLPLLPVRLLELLEVKGFKLIEAPYEEFKKSNTLSTNILAMAPGDCLMLNGLPETRKALIQSGIKVEVFDGNELCIGCEGGPTCLTRPLLRG
ncbi:MAG: arginine deiminase family protein [Paracoccaceae bacterium]|nr:arginine deiminase family protein [Paracoccaceae bacterium]